MPAEVISAIFAAASAVVTEAGGTIAGGHTIRSDEPIFGLAVQGFVHPDHVLTKAGARPGDALVLSKPLGSGIVLAGGTDDDKRAAIARMRELNRRASEHLVALGAAVHAVTDVTGFGLLGHGWEMAERSGVRLTFDAAALPLYHGALGAAAAGTRTGGDPRNRAHLDGHVDIDASVSEELVAIAYDPQTSGGLLASVSADIVGELEGFVAIGSIDASPTSVRLA
jgi:selenide,water dikinase